MILPEQRGGVNKRRICNLYTLIYIDLLLTLHNIMQLLTDGLFRNQCDVTEFLLEILRIYQNSYIVEVVPVRKCVKTALTNLHDLVDGVLCSG